ncbi:MULTISPECIES: cytochrome c biogenesis protein ResB [Mumia]|uniref:cytochrome c biogenesis protein ResB n=1 Tax=Mumia TaxID=1546255 RepID=UPI001421A99F|nr:cytochrome c biogenesis protein ResB [Mumia sp. ZJ1417]QMW65893.1 cytochrome c biogenesis protein ResB [Mumia sp. ZJ1417]
MSEKSRGPKGRATAPALSLLETLRWAWRQLTSMKTALFLLLLLALAAVPGSIVPQRGVDPRAVAAYVERHPDLAPVLDKLGAFHVYTSVWFSAIYLLLMVSLIGCIVPRVGVYARALRARPPKAPRNFSRLPASATYETTADVEKVLDDAAKSLGLARKDTVTETDESGTVVAGEVRAEKGYLREFGNLVFHVSLVVVLVGVASMSLLGYRGNAIVAEGGGYSNTLTQFDEFTAGGLFDTDDLPPFSMTLDEFDSRFELEGPQRGAPRSFIAYGTVTDKPGEEPRPYELKVNHPLRVDGASVYLVGQGYAPVVRVKDGKGRVVFEDAVPFLPSDPTYTSNGVVKVPDARPTQLGFQGFFLPTGVSTGDEEIPMSAHPAAANPVLGLFAYYGDLGLDDGEAQSVYVLDKDELTQFMGDDDKPLRIILTPGESVSLPDGKGTVEFVELRQFARFQFSAQPGVMVPLWGVSIGAIGLVLSLMIRPRRTWVRARRREDGTTLVEVAALDRVPRSDVEQSVDDLTGRLKERTGHTGSSYDTVSESEAAPTSAAPTKAATTRDEA